MPYLVEKKAVLGRGLTMTLASSLLGILLFGVALFGGDECWVTFLREESGGYVVKQMKDPDPAEQTTRVRGVRNTAQVSILVHTERIVR